MLSGKGLCLGLITGGPAQCGVSECDLETSTIRTRPNSDVEPRKKELFSPNCSYFSPISSTPDMVYDTQTESH